MILGDKPRSTLHLDSQNCASSKRAKVCGSRPRPRTCASTRRVLDLTSPILDYLLYTLRSRVRSGHAPRTTQETRKKLAGKLIREPLAEAWPMLLLPFLAEGNEALTCVPPSALCTATLPGFLCAQRAQPLHRLSNTRGVYMPYLTSPCQKLRIDDTHLLSAWA